MNIIHFVNLCLRSGSGACGLRKERKIFMYEFKEEFKTGIDQIDQEHKRLFEIADQIYELKNKEFVHDKYDEIRSILEELRDYTDTHFAHEEAYMESIGYNNMFMQKVQHDALRRQMAEWDLDSIDEHQEETIDEILSIVTDWLVDHILTYDKQIGTK